MTGTFIAPTELTALIGEALRDGDEEMATRYLPEAINRILAANDDPPAAVFEAPTGSTGYQRWDTLIATAFAWALHTRGLHAPAWMTDVAPLSPAWLLDGDLAASDEWRNYIREQTPADFLRKGILIRERDLRTA
ncbi:hypothetical protein [Curtobacterium sp. MCSS17_016]|uniref:hypothetical protein n=1 Tax=Curtobacterium sp. MCSS17_016 TaxID=2175644 RepID=UPI0011B6FC99|nr:hypothetical protein [Curtobacterium sp. MCSS17_016]WIE81003.1 hypothetical protein DEJ19_021035 [Curtobacterium sp. MCSS17_016]